MFIRKSWVPLSVFLVAPCAIAFFSLRSDVPQEPIKVYKTTTPARRAKSEKTIQARSLSASRDDTERPNTAAGGHFHADGTWHAQPHDEPQPNTPTRPVPDPDATEDEVSEWVVGELEILVSQSVRGSDEVNPLF